MGLTESELAELRELQARAYGPSGASIGEESRKRLLDLERTQGTQTRTPPETSAPSRNQPLDDGGAGPGSDDAAEPQADEPSRRRATWATALIAAAAGLIVGFVVAFAMDLGGTKDEAISDIPSPDEWDTGSAAYLGSFISATFWVATRDGGATTCFVIDDPSEQVMSSGETCKNSEEAHAEGLRVGIASVPTEGTADRPGLRVFSVSFSGEDPLLTISQQSSG